MESPRKQRWQQLQSVFEPGFKQMLLISVLLHLLLPVLYYSPFFPKRAFEKPPVYRVNLVNKIVKNPQAGRPEATPVKKQTKPIVKPKPKPKPAVKPKPVPVKPKPVPKPVPVKPKPVPKTKPVTKKPKPKPKPKPAVSKAQETARQKKMDLMRAERERKKALEAMYAAVNAETAKIESPIVNAPPGSITGSGDEIGAEALEYIREFITTNWRFSPYQTVLKNPEAIVDLYYSSSGQLMKYDFVEFSGDSAFDESLKKAIIKSKNLGKDFPLREKITVTFNLKNMLDRQ